MTAEIIPFDFEEQAVRVLVRDGEPWFVAADVCRVLEIANPRDAVGRLDDDEREYLGALDLNVGNPDVQVAHGGARRLSIINESGLYSLIFTSRKDQAKRFRKWVTAEVLPTIRKTGRYDLPGHNDNVISDDAIYQNLTHRDANMWLNIVREARVTRGTAAAVAIWALSPLPPLDARPSAAAITNEDGAACLGHLLGSTYEGRTVADWVHDAKGTELVAYHALARIGLRPAEEGLFVANGSIPALYTLFKETPWVHGKWKHALLALPGTTVPLNPRTLNGIGTRGVIVPWAFIPGGEA